MPRKRKSSIGPSRKYAWKRKPKEDDIAPLLSSEALGDDYCTTASNLQETDATKVNNEPSEVMDHCYSAPSSLEETHTNVSDDCYTLCSVDDMEACEDECDKPIAVPVSDQVVEIETELSPMQLLGTEIMKNSFLGTKYVINFGFDYIQVMEMYNNSLDRVGVKLLVSINSSFDASLFVHRQEVTKIHSCWEGMPSSFSSARSVEILMRRLDTYSVCFGNPDEDIQNITPVNSGISCGNTQDIIAYREENFCASKGNVSYNSSIRSVKCTLLVNGNRCYPCQNVRQILMKRKSREEKRKEHPITKNYVHSRTPHKVMNRENLLTKISQQKEELKSLTKEVTKLKKICEQEIQNKGVKLQECQDGEIKDLMATCHEEMEITFPDKNSFQRLFWEQQCKSANSGKNGMRWHPMIIRWCLYIRSKSATAYDSLRDTGFIKLPSARTLFDYSHFTKSALGFQPDVVKVLHEEAKKLGMLDGETFKSYVGLLFDEIKVKEDLVYDKNTGELIGYCNLDDVGNQILEIEKNAAKSSSKYASCMLVLMVRGVATSMRFPLAGFATNNITADFLYPILWKAVSILEVTVKLKVLFFTCDGASANRKFFQIHRQQGQDEVTYFTPNPHDNTRNIYFISDVPHLLKTTRNCFSNSYSHKMTRRMWKDGKDISWMHVVRLFEEHCEQNLYTPCPKLSRGHIDLSAYSCMKVNLAAQILSGTVANALEEYYGEEVSETVHFIRMFNKFFDCFNVRNVMEGRNKRNPDLNPYKNVADERITWLREEFLGYIKDWEESVGNRRGNLSAGQKASMQLSHQTKTGLEVSVKSITKCIEFMLHEGADFILSHHFNQDPLEQYFGHFRHKGGANHNPTVYDVKNAMTTIQAYRTQALAPKRGNITNVTSDNTQIIDNSKLPKRKKPTK